MICAFKFFLVVDRKNKCTWIIWFIVATFIPYQSGEASKDVPNCIFNDAEGSTFVVASLVKVTCSKAIICCLIKLSDGLHIGFVHVWLLFICFFYPLLHHLLVIFLYDCGFWECKWLYFKKVKKLKLILNNINLLILFLYNIIFLK